MSNKPLIQLEGYVLARGASRRFGSDKARALLRGEPLIVHAVRELSACTPSCTVVADRSDRYADLGLRTITDRVANRGPLGGLHSALHDLSQGDGEWLVLTSCDRIGLRCEWIETLHAAATRTPGTLAATFHDGQLWEPLPSVFHRDLLPQVEQRLTSPHRALHTLLDDCDARAVPVPQAWSASVDINQPADLERLS